MGDMSGYPKGNWGDLATREIGEHECSLLCESRLPRIDQERNQRGQHFRSLLVAIPNSAIV
jgi:hypothetical protein